MYFASKFILNQDDEEYECVSDEEFETGMQISDSGSDDDEKPAEEIGASEKCRSSPKKKSRLSKLQSHWRVPSKSDAASTTETSSHWFRRADTNVMSVKFDTLLSPGNMHAGDPVRCSSCTAILSHISRADNDGDVKVWKCEFCNVRTPVDVEPEEIPKEEDVTYLMEPAMTTTSSNMAGQDQSLVIFCVDTSGSMCVTTEVQGKVKLRGTSHLQRLQSFNEMNEDQYLPSQRNHDVTYVSRLQAMQAAVDNQLGEMAKNYPHRRIGLITFNNEVTIVGDGSQEEVIVAGEKLLNIDSLVKEGSEAVLPQNISNSRTILGEKVYKLEEGGSTALGPALVVAVNMAAHHPGSKVIVCTDGKANVGLGKLEEDADEESGNEFYTSIGESAVAKGVAVSVITIHGTDCKLVHLGKLADKTGGQVNIVDPLKLREEFGNILADPIIATKVKATIILYKTLYVVDDQNPENQECRAEKVAGNVTSTSTITFEFARRRRKKSAHTSIQKALEPQAAEAEASSIAGPSNDAEKIEQASAEKITDNIEKVEETSNMLLSDSDSSENIKEFPFQLQIEYTDTEGNKALRVITRTMPATKDRSVAEQGMDMDVLGVHAAKKSAELALKGQYSQSRGVALMNQRLAWRNSHSSEVLGAEKSEVNRSKYKTIFGKLKQMENRVRGKQMSEIVTFGSTRSDSEGSDDEGAPSLPQHRIGKGQKKVSAGKLRRITSERSSEMEDSFANMCYQFCGAGTDEITAPENKFSIMEADEEGAQGAKSRGKDSTDVNKKDEGTS